MRSTDGIRGGRKKQGKETVWTETQRRNTTVKKELEDHSRGQVQRFTQIFELLNYRKNLQAFPTVSPLHWGVRGGEGLKGGDSQLKLH